MFFDGTVKNSHLLVHNFMSRQTLLLPSFLFKSFHSVFPSFLRCWLISKTFCLVTSNVIYCFLRDVWDDRLLYVSLHFGVFLKLSKLMYVLFSSISLSSAQSKDSVWRSFFSNSEDCVFSVFLPFPVVIGRVSSSSFAGSKNISPPRISSRLGDNSVP